VAEVPLLKELYGKYQERGLEIIGISLDDEPAKVERFVAQNDILWPEICDGKADAGAIPKLYNVSGTPDLYAIDRAGNIAARLSSAKQLDRQLAVLTASAAARSLGPQSPEMAEGSRLDQEGRSKEAKAAFQKAIDNATTPAAKSEAQRQMAISYAFDGDCKNAVKYEEMVIAYWQSQEKEAPGSAFYQQGEVANQAARICIDSDDLTEAERMYRRGRELGLKEPKIVAGRKDLWEFRTEHALARIAARKGNKDEAQKHVAAAKKVLEQMASVDASLHQQQQTYVPYLTGYVALYTGDLQTALADLQKATTTDPFISCLIGLTFEKMGQKDRAMEWYKKASTIRTSDPSGAFARRFTRQKLGGF
jgi:tetratricopeptide (TPR) repeat protein